MPSVFISMDNGEKRIRIINLMIAMRSFIHSFQAQEMHSTRVFSGN
jgi:hypothetical protein